MPAVLAKVSIWVDDNNGSFEVLDEPVADVRAYIEHVEKVVVHDSSYVGPVKIRFGVDLGDEYDGFTRHYDHGRYFYTT